jgi:hypothetical protein
MYIWDLGLFLSPSLFAVFYDEEGNCILPLSTLTSSVLPLYGCGWGGMGMRVEFCP